ncbi:MAG: hypothetical protein E6Q97_19165 [Desulfurellales bacterium]|nr:MAG: hypothetical protein E6Q97_19165 [Desulfurellales bacterium]
MGIIVAGPGAALAFSSASGGKLYAFNNLDATTPVEVAASNPSRQRIRFHNPHASQNMLVYPQYKQNTGANVANAPTIAAPGGGFLIYGNGGTLEFTGGEIQGAWYALMESASNNGPCTVLDSNT